MRRININASTIKLIFFMTFWSNVFVKHFLLRRQFVVKCFESSIYNWNERNFKIKNRKKRRKIIFVEIDKSIIVKIKNVNVKKIVNAINSKNWKIAKLIKHWRLKKKRLIENFFLKKIRRFEYETSTSFENKHRMWIWFWKMLKKYTKQWYQISKLKIDEWNWESNFKITIVKNINRINIQLFSFDQYLIVFAWRKNTIF